MLLALCSPRREDAWAGGDKGRQAFVAPDKESTGSD